MWDTSNGPDGASWWPNWNLWGGRWYLTSACGCPTYVRISEFSAFQTIMVCSRACASCDVRKGSGRWEGCVRGGDNICLDVNQPTHLLYRSPFSIYFALSKVSRLSMVNTLPTVICFPFFQHRWSPAPGTTLWAFARAGVISQNPEFGCPGGPGFSGARWMSLR